MPNENVLQEPLVGTSKGVVVTAANSSTSAGAPATVKSEASGTQVSSEIDSSVKGGDANDGAYTNAESDANHKRKRENQFG